MICSIKKHDHILTSWLMGPPFRSNKSGFTHMFCFFGVLILENLGIKYLTELLNILEGIHVILFCFLIASGYIPDEFSSSKLPHTVQRVHNKGSYRQSDIESKTWKDWLLF